ncbi:MAG: beta-ketoacyl-[acyl-carrier-protein] synthase family protein [Bacteroidota bacterium]|jgi:3-oxoacyl-(acyl-carrier-protein) synthase|nr:beta-ketoacyl-[acyl-carrier-protein] synthase family protein [Bacteroidota bacterium]
MLVSDTEVYISGFGCITPIGNNGDENLQSLRLGQCGIKKPVLFESKYASLYLFGEVSLSNSELCSLLGFEGVKGLTRTDLLAFKAFGDAIQDAGLRPEDISSYDTAFVSASTVGGMCLTDQLYRDSNLQSDNGEFLNSYSCWAHATRIAGHYRIRGLVDAINTACSSSANAIMHGARLIKTGRAKRAIVGGVDALSKYTVNGFNSLQILSQGYCKPFDADRDGLNLGEGACYLVLESRESLGDRKPLAVVAGYGNANDAYHTSSLSDNAIGILRAMQDALVSAGIDPEHIGYVNAHGTGTDNNDKVESEGFRRFFEKIPPFSSTKSFTGHTLGAAGAIEAVYSLFALMYGELYPNLNFSKPEGSDGLVPVLETGKADLRYVMSNSYGFSGNCTSLIFKRL